MSLTHQQIEQFIARVQPLIDTYRSVCDLLLKKKQIVIEGDLDALQRVDNELKGLKKELDKIENERLSYLASQNLSNANFEDILILCPRERRSDMQRLRLELKSTLKLFNRYYQDVERLLQASRQWVDSSIKALRTLTQEEKATAYGSKGQRLSNFQSPNHSSGVSISTNQLV